MIKMNYYLHGKNTVSTADMLRGAATNLSRMADNMDKPNELLAMFNEVFGIVDREKVADKIDEIARGLVDCGNDLRGIQIDERPMPR
jgi:hypothetical protein